MRLIQEVVEPLKMENFITIFANAYPGIRAQTVAERNALMTRLQTRAEDPTVRLMGLEEDGRVAWYRYLL